MSPFQIGALAVLGIIGIYFLGRLVTAAYFQSKLDYERKQRGTRSKQ